MSDTEDLAVMEAHGYIMTGKRRQPRMFSNIALASFKVSILERLIHQVGTYRCPLKRSQRFRQWALAVQANV